MTNGKGKLRFLVRVLINFRRRGAFVLEFDRKLGS
jgi:hypothetical protein